MKFASYNEWLEFIKDGHIPEIRRPILESWKHSRLAGLSPHMFPQKLSQNPVKEPSPYLTRARQELESLLRSLDATRRIAGLLCGTSGEILAIFGTDKNIINVLDSIGIRENVLLSEDSAGSNAVALTINHKCPAVCHGAEHYLEKLHPLTTAAAPLYNPDGSLEGYLALIGIMPDTDCLTLRALTVMVVQLLDRDMRMQRSQVIHNHLKQQISGIFNDDQKATLLISRSGFIRQVNPAALKLFDASETFLDEKNFDSTAKCTPSLKEIAKSAIPCFNQPMEIRLNKRRLAVTFDRIPMFSEKDEFLGSIIFFKGKTTTPHTESVTYARFTFSDIIGNSAPLVRAKELAMKTAETSVSAFIFGPSGTGKEMFAQSIHNASERKDQPFIAINCAAIPREIAESELFGYASGAFTGAKKGGNIGKLEAANKGTVFLDEIGDMPLELQAKLLRMLEERTISRVGSQKEIPVNIRIIAATNRDVAELVETGKFREDLYYRLHVTSIELPKLTDCRDDIPELVEHFITYYNEIMGKKVNGIMPEIMERFKLYTWPGNIRELKNTIEFAVMLNSGEEMIAWKDLPGDLRTILLYRDLNVDNTATSDPLSQERINLQSTEKMLYEKALKLSDYNLSKAAVYLNVGRSTLYRKLKKFGINPR
ncbi:MAG: sigma 54-interacting transcriptional regulator [Victivallaceae bacterium]|nr:sigma 54-interacting transcriptional regulator [Victivallaceae bacterium]